LTSEEVITSLKNNSLKIMTENSKGCSITWMMRAAFGSLFAASAMLWQQADANQRKY
jgi:hypothetical protein